MVDRYYQVIIIKNWCYHKNNKTKGVLSFLKSICTSGFFSGIDFAIKNTMKGKTSMGLLYPVVKKHRFWNKKLPNTIQIMYPC
jgi:hypothetical protein